MSEEDLKYAYKSLIKQAQNASFNLKYYNGDQPLQYSHERLRQVFSRSSVKFIQNWCGVVINSVLDRLIMKGWDDPDDRINTILDIHYKEQKLNIASREIHANALATGNGFLMMDLIEGKVRLYPNSPEQVAVFYQEERPEIMRFGIKVWYDYIEKTTYANLYYPKSIEKYQSPSAPSESSAFKIIEIKANPFKRIPIIHFKAENSLANIITIQDAINKLFSDMMVTAEFNAFRQRWMITNADISSLTASPQSIMQIPKGTSDEEGTQVGEFEAADLNKFLEAMDKLANSIAVISRIPKHYFVQTGSAISGEALIAMEAPLIKKVQVQASTLSQGWNEVALELGGTFNTIVKWDEFKTQQPNTMTEAMSKQVQMGIPLITVLKRNGWGLDEINQMLKDKEEEKKEQANVASQALELALLKSASSNQPFSGEPETGELE